MPINIEAHAARHLAQHKSDKKVIENKEKAPSLFDAVATDPAGVKTGSTYFLADDLEDDNSSAATFGSVSSDNTRSQTPAMIGAKCFIKQDKLDSNRSE